MGNLPRSRFRLDFEGGPEMCEEKFPRDLVLDKRDVFTLWRIEGVVSHLSTESQVPPMPPTKRVVWVFQSEGGEVNQVAADAYFDALRDTVAPTLDSFCTLYDFSLPLTGFMPFALQLAANVGEIRRTMKPVRTVLVCGSATARNVLRLIIRIAGGSSPYVLVDNLEKGWELAFAPEANDESPLRDDFEDRASLNAGLDSSMMALWGWISPTSARETAETPRI